jgi:cytochrome d ubiquinol oxidase subunit I
LQRFVQQDLPLPEFMLFNSKEKNVEFHTKAFRIAAGFALIGAFGAPLSGDVAAKSVAERQPIKLAAMEAHFETEKGASFVIGGIPDEKKKK